MTLYEKWCNGSYSELKSLHFNLTKHTCTKPVNLDSISYPIIDDTCDWKRDIRELYSAYANCIPPVGYCKLNFIPANLKYTSPACLHEDFERSRVALEAYIYLHHLKGDITWDDESRFFVKITKGCVITRKMIIKEN